MKFVLPTAVLAALLFAGPAAAKSSKKAPRATVVKIMKESGQALVYDRNRGEYVVVKKGDTVAGYVVSEVDADQIVLTTPTDPPMHYVLPLVPNAKISPNKKPAPSGDAPKGVRDPYATPNTDVRDPYGDVDDSGDSGDVRDPYGGGGKKRPVTTVLAPEGSRVDERTPRDTAPKTPRPHKTPSVRDPYGGDAPAKKPSTGVRDPYGDAPAEKPSTGVRDPYGSNAPANKPEPAKADANRSSRKLSRKDFDDALSDFHARSKEVELSLEDGGIRIKSIARGSFVARLGLRDNDLILTIAGHKITNADEAAIVYVELSDARAFDIVVLRKGSKHTIHYTFIK